jgi:hypothetical protein
MLLIDDYWLNLDLIRYIKVIEFPEGKWKLLVSFGAKDYLYLQGPEAVVRQWASDIVENKAVKP